MPGREALFVQANHSTWLPMLRTGALRASFRILHLSITGQDQHFWELLVGFPHKQTSPTGKGYPHGLARDMLSPGLSFTLLFRVQGGWLRTHTMSLSHPWLVQATVSLQTNFDFCQVAPPTHLTALHGFSYQRSHVIHTIREVKVAKTNTSLPE